MHGREINLELAMQPSSLVLTFEGAFSSTKNKDAKLGLPAYLMKLNLVSF